MPNTIRGSHTFYSKFAAARILAKLAVYFMAFGLLLLLMGGIRGILFPNHSPSKVLVILGVITSSLGVVYTIVSLVMIRSLSIESNGRITNSSIFNVWVRSASCDDIPMNREPINSVSRLVDECSATANNFSYSNPTLVAAEDAKNWEPPPVYSETDPCPQVVVNVSGQK